MSFKTCNQCRACYHIIADASFGDIEGLGNIYIAESAGAEHVITTKQDLETGATYCAYKTIRKLRSGDAEPPGWCPLDIRAKQLRKAEQDENQGN